MSLKKVILQCFDAGGLELLIASGL